MGAKYKGKICAYPTSLRIVMNAITEEDRAKPQWELLFADDLVHVSERVANIEVELDRWRA